MVYQKQSTGTPYARLVFNLFDIVTNSEVMNRYNFYSGKVRPQI